MKQIYSLVAVLALFVSGCSSTHNVSHNFAPTPNPAIAGYWVGSNSIHTHTMLIRPDGTGELCWEGFGRYQTTRVTISGKKIIAMSEADFSINPFISFSKFLSILQEIGIVWPLSILRFHYKFFNIKTNFMFKNIC